VTGQAIVPAVAAHALALTALAAETLAVAALLAHAAAAGVAALALASAPRLAPLCFVALAVQLVGMPATVLQPFVAAFVPGPAAVVVVRHLDLLAVERAVKPRRA
jgi:hypothetical protein